MINCRAVEEHSIFVTARGDILPCCWMYYGGPALTAVHKLIANDENFSKLTNSWSTARPFHLCKAICDDNSTDKLSMKLIKDQYRVNNL